MVTFSSSAVLPRSHFIPVHGFFSFYLLPDHFNNVLGNFGPDSNISLNIGWTVMKFSTFILRVNCDNFGDPLTSHLPPSSGHNCNLSNTLVDDQTPTKQMPFPVTSNVSMLTLALYLLNIRIVASFHVAPSSGQTFWFKYLQN